MRKFALPSPKSDSNRIFWLLFASGSGVPGLMLRLWPALAILAGWSMPSAKAGPYTYKEANNFSAQLQRAFSPPPSSITVPVYRSTVTSSGIYSTSSSPRTSSSAGGWVSPSDTQSWAMPMRQPSFNWGPGYVKEPDPDGDKIAAARRNTWELPMPAHATVDQIARYYRSKGVSTDRATQAAEQDREKYQRAVRRRESDEKWAAYHREQRRISAYLAEQTAGRAEFRIELAAVRNRALSSGGDGTGTGADPALAAAWLDLAGFSQMWRGIYIQYDPLARREAVFFAARAGVPRGITSAWIEASDAGEDAHYWRAQSALVGDIVALTAIYREAMADPGTGVAAAAALFEQAFQVMPAQPSPRDRVDLVGAARAQCAVYLSRLYSRGSTDLPADPKRALAWAQKAPVAPPDHWQEMRSFNRVQALHDLTGHFPTARALETEILAEWEGFLNGPADTRVRKVLYPIYLGRNWAFPHSADPDKARALFPEGPNDLELILEAGDWASAAKFENLPLTSNDRLPLLMGRVWNERTDGKRDVERARTAFELALSDPKYDQGGGEAAVGLCEILLEKGDRVAAQLTLERASQTASLFSNGRPRLRLALGYYRGDFYKFEEKKAEQIMKQIAEDYAELPTGTAVYLNDFAQDFEFQRVAAPLLNRFNRVEGVRRGTTDPSPAEIEDIARQHRENFAVHMPALRELALKGYPPAMRLWSMLTLSNYADPTPTDAGLAKTYLYESATAGDVPAIVVLSQRLYLDAQAACQESGTGDNRLRDQVEEAALWLEASWKTGDTEALRSLYTIYHENLGGLGSSEKAEAYLRELASAGDRDSAAKVAQLEFEALLPPPPRADLPPDELQAARAQRFALVRQLALTDDPDHPVAQRELNRMILRGDQEAAFAEETKAFHVVMDPLKSSTPEARFVRIEQLADEGNPVAKRELALMKFRGEGTAKDTSEESGDILFLLEEAAQEGDFTAALWRARIQYDGLYFEAGMRDEGTIMQDQFAANEFLQDLAHNGSPQMKYRIGLLYLNDKNLEPECFMETKPESLERAYALFEQALEGGVEVAREPLERLRASFSPKQGR